MNVERFMIRAWCDENDAEGQYTITANGEDAAREQAAAWFREDCAVAAALVAPAETVHTEMLSA